MTENQVVELTKRIRAEAEEERDTNEAVPGLGFRT